MHLAKDFVVELSQRLADEPDYDSYIRPRLEALLDVFSDPRDEASGNVTGAKPQ
jgi:hypothetical protein